MLTSELKLYGILKDKLGKRSRDIYGSFRRNCAEESGLAKSNLATKEDSHETKIDLIKWVLGFWITLMLMTAHLYLKK